MNHINDIIGKVFGKLTVIKLVDGSPSGGRYLCRCECGKESVVLVYYLHKGKTKSCGCKAKETLFKRTHGMTNTSEFNIWSGMIDRCTKPSWHNRNYYGRGIKVCDRWLNSFENFYADMGPKPSAKHSIDRIDVNGNYCPENCRWATTKEQMNNKRNNVILEYNGTKKTLSEWSEYTGIPYGTLTKRINAKWSLEKAFTELIKQPVLLTFNGETKRLHEWEKITGLHRGTIQKRLLEGWSVEKTMTTPKIGYPRRGKKPLSE